MSDATSQSITLTPTLPPAPLVLCSPGFLKTLSGVEHEVAHIAITDSQSAQAAANLLQRLTTAGKALDDTRAELNAPYLAIQRQINDAARAPSKRIEDAKALIKRKRTDFDTAERERVAAEEAARRAEIARLEKQAKAEQEERDRKAKELADAAAAVQADMLVIDDDPPSTIEYGPQKTETELALERAKVTATVPAARVVGERWLVKLRIKDVDVAKLPEPFVIRQADMTKLRQLYTVGWKENDAIPEVPGVTFEIDKQPMSSGRAVF